MTYYTNYKEPKSILNKGTGFLKGYSHSLNPYTGCSFACSYCYVRQMPVALFRGEEWGTWVDIKKNAAALLEKEINRAKHKGKVTIFMSSSTDPYQPVESEEKVTRSLLEAMIQSPVDFLLVQTRSPLVTRDIDLLKKFGDRVRVSMTVETDLDAIRKRFTPKAPPIAARILAMQKLVDEGIAVQAAVAPILPFSPEFPKKLSQVTGRVCLDNYWLGDGSGGQRTARLGMEHMYRAFGVEPWYEEKLINEVYSMFCTVFAKEQIYISQAGFEP